ncbi:M43 family zinc metalloprotease [Marinoscillum furvescens]|uniref:Pregnancy-associated plasma protein-A n=1 Tax=Marinoscillum furvescens DSM 4134 TaxID=1122208 RepID=A0A3D9KX63_MARFU|nr:M43 family zinc metalloprotease [Marinoscillum furvescens]RED92034.1 pregnancy-associated plasma protein-A [Marinoscillum furvescens DSM 4134]
MINANMKQLILFIFTILNFSLTLKAQTCGTPIPANPIIYSDEANARTANSTFCIDIFFHIVRNTNGSNAFPTPNLNAIVDELNNFYNVHGIFIRNAGSDNINNTSFVILDARNGSSEDDNLFATQTRSDAINFYIVDRFVRSHLVGKAQNIPSNALVMRDEDVISSISAHELGHCLNLYHTFQGTDPNTSGCAEAINGSNCNSCGDLVCDTPADQNTGIFGGYSPDLTNIMSYYLPADHFTTGQGWRMRTAISRESALSGITGTSCTIPKLSSIDHLCNSGTKTITVSNLGANTTTWTVSPYVSIVSSNNSSITVEASSSSAQGNAFVRASFSNTTYNPSERFWVGKPKLYDPSISGSGNVGCNSIYIYDYLGSVGGASSTRWVVSLQFDNISSVNDYELFVDPTNGGDGFVTLVASNDCGEDMICKPVSVTGWSCGPGYINFPTEYSCGGGGGFPSFGLRSQSNDFTIFPNPTSDGETTVLSTNQETLSEKLQEDRFQEKILARLELISTELQITS